MTGRRDLAAEAARRRARAGRRLDRQAALARPLLVAIEGGPGWLYRLVPDGAYVALLKCVQTQDDRRAAAVYSASCERAREAWIAQREAMGPGCPYCPNEELNSYDAGGDRYHECPVCGAAWPIGPSPDDDNDYDELRPLRSATKRGADLMEDTNTFALISPTGTLTFEEGVPDQARAKVEDSGGAEGFTVAHASSGEPGLRAYVGSNSALKFDEYSQVGSGLAIVLAASYGGRLQVDVYGYLAVCGWEMDSDRDGAVAGLTLLQQDLVTNAHAEVLRLLADGAAGEAAR